MHVNGPQTPYKARTFYDTYNRNLMSRTALNRHSERS